MASYTRRDFIRRGVEGAAGLGLLAPGKEAASAASGRRSPSGARAPNGRALSHRNRGDRHSGP